MKDLFARLQRAVRQDPKTAWYDVVSKEGIEYAEEVFGFKLPKILRRAYREISNGGFGPWYGIIGLPGGNQSSFGDLLETWALWKDDEEFEEGWLPIIDWGCCDFQFIDCDNDFLMVTRYQDDFHRENYTFDELLERWIEGEEPELHSGGFWRPKQ